MNACLNSHHIQFYREVSNRKWIVAECSCGWKSEGAPGELYSRAACHDLDVPEGKRVEVQT